MKAHARLAPSAASRWMKCPGSVSLAGMVKEPESSFESDEGTAAHEIHEACLRTGLDPWAFVGHKVKVGGRVFECTEQWAYLIEPIIDRLYMFGGKMFAEKRVKLDRWMPQQFGTLDSGIIDAKLADGKYIVITDFKFGIGVPVEVENNPQLMIYALGFWDNIARHETKTEKFILRIEQPRISGVSGDWHVSLDSLLAFGEKLRKAAIRTYHKDAPRIPGEKQCLFCPAKMICPEYRNWIEELTGLQFEELDRRVLSSPPEMPSAMTPLQRSHILLAAPMIRKWFDRLEEQALADYAAGRGAPLLKLVEGRKGHRMWTDANAVKRLVSIFAPEEGFSREVKTPSQLQPFLLPEEWAAMQEFIRQDTGRPKLVSSESRRPELSVASKFDKIELDD